MIALSTGSLFTYGTARVARLAAAAGFDGLEIMIDDRWDLSLIHISEPTRPY